MKLSKYLKTREGALAENKVGRYISGSLALAVLVLAFGLTQQKTTVVLVPPTLDKESWVAASGAGPEIQVAWGAYITNLLGNITPRSAPMLKEQLSKNMTTSMYNKVLESIDVQVKEIVEEKVTLSWAPTKAYYDAEQGYVIVTGELVIRGLRDQERREVRTYEMGFETGNYKVLLNHLRPMIGSYVPVRKEKD